MWTMSTMRNGRNRKKKVLSALDGGKIYCVRGTV